MLLNITNTIQLTIILFIIFIISFGIGFILILAPYLIKTKPKKVKYKYRIRIKKEKFNMDEQVIAESEKGLYSVDGKNAIDNYYYNNKKHR